MFGSDYESAAFFSMVSAILITVSAYTLMVCVRRIGRQVEELRYAITLMENLTPIGNRKCPNFHAHLDNRVRTDDFETAAASRADCGSTNNSSENLPS